MSNANYDGQSSHGFHHRRLRFVIKCEHLAWVDAGRSPGRPFPFRSARAAPLSRRTRLPARRCPRTRHHADRAGHAPPARPAHARCVARAAPAGAGAPGGAGLRARRCSGSGHARRDRTGRDRTRCGLRTGFQGTRRPARRTAAHRRARPDRARPTVGGGHGQAGCARAQCVERHRPDLRVRPRRRDRRQCARPQPHQQPRVLRQGGQTHLQHGGRNHRARPRVPGRPGAATQRQFGPERGVAGRAGGVFPGAGPRVGALCLAQEPRDRARRLRRRRQRQRACAARCCPSCSAATSTTACSTRCARCTARSASTRPNAPPATRAAPTT